MGEFLKRFVVNGATLTLHGLAVTENPLGEKAYNRCGMLWDPREIEDRTVEVKVGVILEGKVGDHVKLTICEGWAGKDRQIEAELEPFFKNDRDEIKRFASKKALFVAIEGSRDTETWIVSWWRMPSGRIFFDLAKNRFRVNELPGRTQQAKPDNGNGDEELSQEQKDEIAAAQAGLEKKPGGKRNHRTERSEIRTDN